MDKEAKPYFNGEIRGTRVYNRVLSPQEIGLIYKYERIGFLPWWYRLWFWTKELWLSIIGRIAL